MKKKKGSAGFAEKHPIACAIIISVPIGGLICWMFISIISEIPSKMIEHLILLFASLFAVLSIKKDMAKPINSLLKDSPHRSLFAGKIRNNDISSVSFNCYEFKEKGLFISGHGIIPYSDFVYAMRFFKMNKAGGKVTVKLYLFTDRRKVFIISPAYGDYDVISGIVKERNPDLIIEEFDEKTIEKK